MITDQPYCCCCFVCLFVFTIKQTNIFSGLTQEEILITSNKTELKEGQNIVRYKRLGFMKSCAVLIPPPLIFFCKILELPEGCFWNHSRVGLLLSLLLYPRCPAYWSLYHHSQEIILGSITLILHLTHMNIKQL